MPHIRETICVNSLNCWELLSSNKTISSQTLCLIKPDRGRFNDYPEKEYTQAGGKGEHPEKGEDIV